MSEFSFTSSKKKTEFSSLLLSDFFHLCFFILSHPLYFSYFIFFSPYLLKLLSFLSPLFITTLLLLIVLLTTVSSPNLVQENSHSESELSESKPGFLVTTYQTVLQRLQPKVVDDENEDFQQFEEFEVYKIVFDTSTFEIRDNPVDVLEFEVKEICSESFEAEAPDDNSDAYRPVETTEQAGITHPPIMVVKRLESFFQEKDELENMSFEKEEKEVNTVGVESYKVEEQKEKPSMITSGSKVTSIKVSADDSQRVDKNNGGDQYCNNSQPMENNSLGSFGSMRKEKEWRRTLACKLFEERHNVDGGGEGMDMLWETYETESSKVMKSKTKKGKKNSVEYDEDDEEEEDTDEQLCCLQALKFSAGKMNLGMGRPNLVKISKAFKGIGWLHNLSRHGKKGYH